MFEPDDPLAPFVYPIMAAIAGAVTALSRTKWRTLTLAENIMTLFVGCTFALVFTPWLVHIMGWDGDVRTIAFVTYIAAVGSNVLIPRAIALISRWAGLGEGND